MSRSFSIPHHFPVTTTHTVTVYAWTSLVLLQSFLSLTDFFKFNCFWISFYITEEILFLRFFSHELETKWNLCKYLNFYFSLLILGGVLLSSSNTFILFTYLCTHKICLHIPLWNFWFSFKIFWIFPEFLSIQNVVFFMESHDFLLLLIILSMPMYFSLKEWK